MLDNLTIKSLSTFYQKHNVVGYVSDHLADCVVNSVRCTRKPGLMMSRCLIFLLCSYFSSGVQGREINVAVASNFYSTLLVLKQEFESSSEHTLIIMPGSTGKLYAQIINGAPFDIFMAADKKRPMLLEQNSYGIGSRIRENRLDEGEMRGRASEERTTEKKSVNNADKVKVTRFTYARGRLVLWSPDSNRQINEGEILQSDEIERVALANPKLAPYGKAAKAFIDIRHQETLRSKLVQGENISQAFHLVASGSAEIGFVALSQLKNPNRPVIGNYWIIPEKFHQPIEQQAILLKDNEAANEFFAFLQSERCKEIITQFGYQKADDSQREEIR